MSGEESRHLETAERADPSTLHLLIHRAFRLLPLVPSEFHPSSVHRFSHATMPLFNIIKKLVVHRKKPAQQD